jgi:hypothetical protein
MGRFMSPDFNDDDDDLEPVPYADLGNPQSLNLYAYVGNNPLNSTDRDGHFTLNCAEECRRQRHELEMQQYKMLFGVFGILAERALLGPYLFNKLHPAPATNTSPASAESTPADPNQQKPKFEPNKGKHHQNAKGKASREPANSEDLYNKAIKSNDKPGTWWAQDSDGVLHRFSSDNADGAHWSGSTAGENGIESQNIPRDIKQAFGWKK